VLAKFVPNFTLDEWYCRQRQRKKNTMATILAIGVGVATAAFLVRSPFTFPFPQSPLTSLTPRAAQLFDPVAKSVL
jgi:hypothetical protein